MTDPQHIAALEVALTVKTLELEAARRVLATIEMPTPARHAVIAQAAVLTELENLLRRDLERLKNRIR